MSKTLYQIPEFLLKQLERLGYQRITAADQRIFNPYYNEMNGFWCCALSFCSMLAWDETSHVFYKRVAAMISCLEYDTLSGELMAIPFLGRYTPEQVADAFRVLRADMETLNAPLLIEEVSPWMLPFYQGLGVSWEITDLREVRDYIYQRADFVASMNRADSRYRYRYFIRRFEPEAVELTRAHREECLDCMREIWCAALDCSYCHYGCPMHAADRALSMLGSVLEDGLLVRVGGKAVGFCVACCRNGLGIYHIKYADNRLKGINEYLLRESFERFFDGVEEINYTEDMGIAGLREYKSKLAPYTLLPRLTLRQTENASHRELSCRTVSQERSIYCET